jgi:hypothetical protein
VGELAHPGSRVGLAWPRKLVVKQSRRWLWVVIAVVVVDLLLAAIFIGPHVVAERNAHWTYDYTLAEYEVEQLGDPLDICRTAHDWMLAQRGLFWRNRSRDYDAYLDLIRNREALQHGRVSLTMYGDDASWQAAKKKADEFTKWREDAERSPERP